MRTVTAATLAQTCLAVGMTEEETCRLLHDNGFRPPEPVVERINHGRRAFIVQMAAAVTAAAVLPDDPLKLLWTPDERKIIIDAPEVRPATTQEVVNLFEERSKEFADFHREMRRAAFPRFGRTRVDAIVGGQRGSKTYNSKGEVIAQSGDARVVDTPWPSKHVHNHMNRPQDGFYDIQTDRSYKRGPDGWTNEATGKKLILTDGPFGGGFKEED